jgi:hypothetical protein
MRLQNGSPAPAAGIRPPFPLERLRGAIFDMDGVVTQTATLHFAAWKDLFDQLL